MGILKDRIAIITGAGGEIGRQTAVVFAREGATVVLADLDEVSGQETARLIRDQGGTASFVQTDIADGAQVQQLVDHAVTNHGRLDCAFNNAGLSGPLHPGIGYPADAFDRVIDVNVRGTWQCLQAELAVMVEQQSGAIVNTSSGLGVVGAPGMAPYAASKHAVMGFTQALALETATLGVRINAVLPGIIDTNMPAQLTAGQPEVMDAFLAGIPAGRFGAASEIAEAVAWLCSDRASYVTGHGLVVDGGYLAQ